MNTTQLSKEFSQIYPEILEYAQKACAKTRSIVDPYTIVSHSYIHVYRWKESIKDTSGLKAYAKTFIKNQLYWKNTPILKEETLIGYGEPTKEQMSEESEPNTEQILSLISAYESSLPLYKKRLFNLYWREGLGKAREISNRVKCSLSTSYIILKECRNIMEDFREFIKKESQKL